MQFGLFFINEKPPGRSDQQVFNEALEQCRVADELGFDCLWFGEHHFAPYGTMADTTLFGAAASQVTQTIQLGTACIVPAFAHPVRVAEQCAMLDVLSGGRFHIGLGRGYQQREFKGYGVPQSESKARFREAVEIIEGLLTTENFTYEGQFWQTEDLTIAPMPVQERPPIYVAASITPDSFEWLVEKDFGALIGNPYSVDPGVGTAATLLLEMQRAAGRPESLDRTWGLLHNVLVDADAGRAAEIFRPNWDLSNSYLLKYAQAVEDGSPLPDDYKNYAGWWDWLEGMQYDDMLQMNACLIGDPDGVAEKLNIIYESTGVYKHLMWMNRGGAVPQSEMLRSMELFAEKVIPQVRHIGEPAQALAG